MRAAELGLQDQARAEGMDPARAVILAGVVGDRVHNAGQPAGSGCVVVDGAVAEPDEVLGADVLVDAGV